MLRTRLFTGAVAAMSFSTLISASHASVILTSTDRTVFALASNATPDTQSQESTTTGLFSGNVTRGNGNNATQNSTLTAQAGQLSFSGTGLAQGTIGTVAGETGRGDSEALISFKVVDQPETVSLTVVLAGGGEVDTATGSITNSAFVRLRNEGTAVDYVNVDRTTAGQQTVTLTTTLPVGQYVLDVGADSIGQAFDNATTQTASVATFNVTNFAVTPEPTSAAVMLGVAGALALRRRSA